MLVLRSLPVSNFIDFLAGRGVDAHFAAAGRVIAFTIESVSDVASDRSSWLSRVPSMDCAGDDIDETVLSGIDGADSGYDTLDPVADVHDA